MANDATRTHRMAESSKRVTINGYTFTDQFYIANYSDLALYELPFRTPTWWIPEDEWVDPLIQPYVIDTNRKSFTPDPGPPWVLTVTSATTNMDVRIGNGGRLEDQKFVEYSKLQYRYEAAWWGLREADSADETALKLNQKSLPCKKGELIFINATTSSPGDSSRRKQSELKSDWLDANVGKAGLPVTLTKATITFLTRDPAASYVMFEGVNGDIPASYQIPYSSVEDDIGRWKVLDQRILNHEFPEDGKIVPCRKVIREIALSPSDTARWNTTDFKTWEWKTTLS